MSGNLGKSILVSRPKREALFWGLIVLTLVVDLLTKYLAQEGYFRHWGIAVLSGYVENKGVTFGMLQGQRWPILIIGFLLVGGLVWFRYKSRADLKLDFIIALLIGGAAGNMYDRIRFGHVRDFIQWPVFNMADVFICAGVAYFIVEAIYSREREKKDGGQSGADTKAE